MTNATATMGHAERMAERFYADLDAALDAIDGQYNGSAKGAALQYAETIKRMAVDDAPTANQGAFAGDFAEALFAPTMRTLYLKELEGIDWYAIAERTVDAAVKAYRS